jgi:deazaflavin-dependent oxidoreductase (nitroreductase family)
MGGALIATKPGATFYRRIVAPLEAPMMKATGGRMSLTGLALPMVVLTSTGARSGQLRETPLTYFTDGDDVIVGATNFGGVKHPSWYHNLRAHPECELHIGPRGGPFLAREAEGADRERLFALAVELFPGFNKYAQKTQGIRTVKVLRLRAAPLLPRGG